ncbi:P63C domain-containing protein [Serratia marcescens]|uniref:P63C domain-containing protein n=1 Tax=Serratia marcescens TaxID=615 RepID=UPI00276C2571|nr:P63C domain-containing protein [Serratia marcescens]MDP8753873.1 P63C domain-containing protein [Serratia marcescens]MDP8758534.1 P63C domain-containing protein [Serratia marcescens]MDP8768275.1 P63C domain-containing protein [Serratia marcescens]MDP8878379.1 P63C domain-containing protein [Serratia marcescens]
MADVIDNHDEPNGKAKGGKARAAKMTTAEKKAASLKMVQAKAELAAMPKVIAGSNDEPLRIGEIELECYVLDDENKTRVFSQRGLASALGWDSSQAAARLANFTEGGFLNPFVNKEITEALRGALKFKNPHTPGYMIGYPATILADLCDAILSADAKGVLKKGQEELSRRALLLVRGFARVGIVALVDEATGYQRIRERDSLAKILEAFVAKELQPWVHTFSPDYYEQMCRLRGIPYPPQKRNFPAYFGTLTNKIVYDRLAPGLREELKAAAARSKKSGRLHQHLTQEIGHPKLREHLSSVVTVMKLSTDYDDFESKFEVVHPELPKLQPPK